MRVLVQWAGDAPTDWEAFDSRHFASVPDRHINQLNVQGVHFGGDHYAVENMPGGGCRVYCWSEDGMEPYARIVEFGVIAPDPKCDGGYNTHQANHLYAGPELYQHCLDNPSTRQLYRIGQFAAPPPAITRHGIWLADALYEAHLDHQSAAGWRTWTEGVPAEMIVDGKLRQQRPLDLYNHPRGTETYYVNYDSIPNGIHVADFETSIDESAQGSSTLKSAKATVGHLTHVFTSASNIPKDGSWATGDYRYQIDATEATADMSYGVLTQGTGSGHFARVNSAITSDLETKTQQESAFEGTGTNTASTGSVSWSSGSNTDRWEIAVAAYRYVPGSHASCYLGITVGEADDWTDGPWVPETTYLDPGMMMCNT